MSAQQHILTLGQVVISLKARVRERAEQQSSRATSPNGTRSSRAGAKSIVGLLPICAPAHVARFLLDGAYGVFKSRSPVMSSVVFPTTFM